MCRKIIAIVVAILTANFVSISSVMAQKRQLSPEQAKAELAKLGTGPKALVRVTLKNNTKVQGWLSAAGEDYFTITSEKNGTLTDIKYSDVTSVKSLKPSKAALIAGIAGGLSLAVVIALFVGPKH